MMQDIKIISYLLIFDVHLHGLYCKCTAVGLNMTCVLYLFHYNHYFCLSMCCSDHGQSDTDFISAPCLLSFALKIAAVNSDCLCLSLESDSQRATSLSLYRDSGVYLRVFQLCRNVNLHVAVMSSIPNYIKLVILQKHYIKLAVISVVCTLHEPYVFCWC